MNADLMWALHNLVAHPVSELCHWAGYVDPRARNLGNWIHDRTVPAHEPGTGRG